MLSSPSTRLPVYPVRSASGRFVYRWKNTRLQPWFYGVPLETASPVTSSTGPPESLVITRFAQICENSLAGWVLQVACYVVASAVIAASVRFAWKISWSLVGLTKPLWYDCSSQSMSRWQLISDATVHALPGRECWVELIDSFNKMTQVETVCCWIGNLAASFLCVWLVARVCKLIGIQVSIWCDLRCLLQRDAIESLPFRDTMSTTDYGCTHEHQNAMESSYLVTNTDEIDTVS